ncbi:prefoldin subunit alpha [Candidatus Woesearchaeota archaeon]|nr:prefoldin subunit alpha [Candidatus Woesearchaeota archaeon]
MEKQNMQQKQLMLQLIGAQMQEIEKEVIEIENKSKELTNLKGNLDSLKETKKSAKAFPSLGMGIFAEGNITNTKEVLVNIGSNIVVKKDIESTKKLLDNQIKQTKDISKKLTQNMQNLVLRAQGLEQEIKNSISKKK